MKSNLANEKSITVMTLFQLPPEMKLEQWATYKDMFQICSVFIRRGGVISCCVTGSRQYSVDLEKGGMQILCMHTFSSKECSKPEKSL